MRELTYLFEEQGQAWAGDMIELLSHASHLDKFNCADGKTPNYAARKYQRKATMHKQGANIFNSLVAAFKGAPPQPCFG